MNLEKTCAEYYLTYSKNHRVFRYIINKYDFTPEYSKFENMRPGWGFVETLDLGTMADKRRVFLARGKIFDVTSSSCSFNREDADIVDMDEFYRPIFDYLEDKKAPGRRKVLLESDFVKDLFKRKEFLERTDYGKMVDEELVIHSLLGNEETFTELYKRYLPIIQWKATGFNIPAHDSLDLIQVGGIYLWQSLKDYNGKNKATFRKFFSKSLVNHLIDLRRIGMAQKRNPPKDGKGGRSNFSYDTLMGKIMLENFCARAWHQDQQNQ